MNKKGFTLIELLAVILILGIIALIAIPAVTNAIEDSKKHASEVTALSYIKAINDQNALYKLQPDKFTPITSGDVDDIIVNLKGDGPTSGTVTITNGKVTEAELCASGYTVTYNGVSTTVEGKCGTAVTNKSLLEYIETIEETGIYQTTINNVTYDLNVIVLEGNQTITTNTSYGTLDDCASGTDASQMATRMVVVKVNGNYTVNSNVTVGPTYNETYGGPKGFLLYVTGTLTNNGTIDNSHGAYALGQDVYLYKNLDNTYEYIPNVGAGSKTNGASSNKRATGGGGSSNGGSGTSYSGGSGGSTSAATLPSEYGGKGAIGAYSSGKYEYAGGAGNPAGCSDRNAFCGKNGTGGLLIIYANGYINNGTITANGKNGVNVASAEWGAAPEWAGAASGGGSINIFTNQAINPNQLSNTTDTIYNNMLGSVNANGGKSYNGSNDKNAAGNGTINIGRIVNGQYQDLRQTIEQAKQ